MQENNFEKGYGVDVFSTERTWTQTVSDFSVPYSSGK